MKMRLLKIVGATGVVALLGVAGVFAWSSMAWPPSYEDAPMPDIDASEESEVVEEGEYLFHTVAHCTACHTPSEEIQSLEEGEQAVPSGGTEWALGPIGTLRASNITPHPETGVGEWSDAELARVLRHTVNRDDKPAMMMNFVGPMSDEDLTAIISYMRTIEPVENEVPDHEVTALGRLMLQTTLGFLASGRPETMEIPEYVPRGETSAERGEYLAHGPAMCVYCHSEMEMSTGELTGAPFAGGVPTPDPTDGSKEIVAPNITTGGMLENWNEEAFVTRMRAGRPVEGSAMPWENYAGMTDADLESIFLYLETVEPSDHDPGPAHREAGWAPE